MAGTGTSRGIITGINVTPMVDVTLVLLVIFIVTAKIVVTPAVPLDLPPASKSEEVQVVFSVILVLSVLALLLALLVLLGLLWLCLCWLVAMLFLFKTIPSLVS